MACFVVVRMQIWQMTKWLRLWSCDFNIIFSSTDEFLSNSAHSASKNQSDLNKENQKPVPKFDKRSEVDSCKNSSLDELEEGEIRSDSEESIPQKNFEKSAKPRASAEVQKSKATPGDRKNTVYLHTDHRKTSVKIHQDNNRWNKDQMNLVDTQKQKEKIKQWAFPAWKKYFQLFLYLLLYGR